MAPNSSKRNGWIKGRPLRYVFGHRPEVDPADYFRANVDQRGPDECWPWTGCLLDTGYGQATVNGRRTSAHRLSWEVANGRPIPRGLQVLHSCDNPPCVNPAHLSVGTNDENMRQAAERNRMAFGERHPRTRIPDAVVEQIRLRCAAGERAAAIGAEFGLSGSTVSAIYAGRSRAKAAGPTYFVGPRRGETAARAKLTDQAVREIRRRVENGERGADLAREYGVDSALIYRVAQRKSWAHVE